MYVTDVEWPLAGSSVIHNSTPDFASKAPGFDWPAFLIVMILTVVLVRGIRESAETNNVMVLIKIAAILIFVSARRGYDDELLVGSAGKLDEFLEYASPIQRPATDDQQCSFRGAVFRDLLRKRGCGRGEQNQDDKRYGKSFRDHGSSLAFNEFARHAYCVDGHFCESGRNVALNVFVGVQSWFSDGFPLKACGK